MSFREGIYEYTNKQLRSLKEINCIFLNKTHDIKFIMQHKEYNCKKLHFLKKIIAKNYTF